MKTSTIVTLALCAFTSTLAAILVATAITRHFDAIKKAQEDERAARVEVLQRQLRLQIENELATNGHKTVLISTETPAEHKRRLADGVAFEMKNGSPHTWVFKTGRQFTAFYLSADETNVVVSQDREHFKLTRADLCEADQELVKMLMSH
jgi:hypothetical protein